MGTTWIELHQDDLMMSAQDVFVHFLAKLLNQGLHIQNRVRTAENNPGESTVFSGNTLCAFCSVVTQKCGSGTADETIF